MTRHEVLRERLAAFELGGGARGTEDPEAAGPERSTMPQSSGSSGPTTVRSMPPLRRAVGECMDIVHFDRNDRRRRRDPVVSGGTRDLDAAFSRELPREGMLTAARADDEHLHAA